MPKYRINHNTKLKFDFEVEHEAEIELYHKIHNSIFPAGCERIGCIDYSEGYDKVIDFWEDSKNNVIILARRCCMVDPTPYFKEGMRRTFWHTHPWEKYPLESENDIQYMLNFEIDYGLVLGQEAYLIIERDENQFRTKYVEWHIET